jgi:serine/threonine-protein kinase RsbW
MSVTTIANPQGYPGYTATMPCTEDTVRDARALVRTIVAVWGLDDLADGAALVVSELFTNAVVHTDTILVRVTVKRPEHDLVRVDVADRSPDVHALRTTGDTDEGGRGLALVAALTTRWGTEPSRKGKSVWGELRSTR